jgi:formate dehydrogenase alpha subunit
MSNSINELEDAPLILACGTNTTESHPIIALRVKKAVAEGSKLIVVDPRKIGLVDFAHRWLRLRVGTDIALYNAMAHVIVEEGLYEEDYVADRTAGFEELRGFLKAYTPEYAEQITGVPKGEIAAAAREYAVAERAAIIYTLGITEHSCGVHNVQSLANLALLCGNFGIPNAGVNPLRGQNNVQGTGDVGCDPAYLPGYQRVDADALRANWERAWGVKLDPTPGTNQIRSIDEIMRGDIRAAYIVGANNAVSDPNVGKTRRALQAIEFLVVQDIFLTETAQMAHVALPAASFAEVDGTFTNTERRVQRVRKAVDPPGQAKPDWMIIMELANRMGYPMHYEHPSQIWDELASNTPILGGINYDRIELQGIQWPCPTPDHPGTQYLHEHRFLTEKGYFQMVSHVPPAEPPDEEYPFVLTTGRRRPTYHTGAQTGRVQGFGVLVPHEWLEISPEDAAKLRLSDGEEVEVVSRRGRVRVPAKITDRSPVGVVFMSFHFPTETLTNLLTTDSYDPITETPEFKACAVRVEKMCETQ